jgi:serine/threonine protein kinase
VQSRFYRAPEVILGLPYEYQVDMWSLGCIISELYSGVSLFPALDENELLEFHILLSGNPAQYMIECGKKKDKFFNARNGNRIIRSPKSRLVHLTRS